MLVVGTSGEVHIIAGIDCCRRLVDGVCQLRNLTDGTIVAHHHAIEAKIALQDVLQDFGVRHTVCAMHRMISWHDDMATRQANDCLMRHENLLHQLFLVGIATAAIAEIMLRARTDALLEVALLHPLDKCRTHHSRQIGILAVRLFQTIETGRAAHIDHWRERQHGTHLPHGSARLAGL